MKYIKEDYKKLFIKDQENMFKLLEDKNINSLYDYMENLMLKIFRFDKYNRKGIVEKIVYIEEKYKFYKYMCSDLCYIDDPNLIKNDKFLEKLEEYKQTYLLDKVLKELSKGKEMPNVCS